MAKKVILGPKPQQNQAANADKWVSGNPRANSVPASEPNVPTGDTVADASVMKRLTIDVPEALHAQIKSRCALKGVKMADEIRALLETHFLMQEEA